MTDERKALARLIDQALDDSMVVDLDGVPAAFAVIDLDGPEMAGKRNALTEVLEEHAGELTPNMAALLQALREGGTADGRS